MRTQSRQTEPKSFLHRAKIKLGFTFIDVGMVRVIYKNEVADTVLDGPAYHYHSFFKKLTERLGPPIQTTIRMVKVLDIPIHSLDRFKVRMDVHGRFSFNPKNCHSRDTMHRFSSFRPAQLADMMQSFIAEETRKECEQYEEAHLICGSNHSRLERRIRLRLTERCMPFGIEIPQNGGIVIADVTGPPNLDKDRQEAQRRAIYIESLARVSESMAQNLHLQELVRNSSNAWITLDNPNLSGGDNQATNQPNGHVRDHSPLAILPTVNGPGKISAKPNDAVA
jgi:hypothetical protein